MLLKHHLTEADGGLCARDRVNFRAYVRWSLTWGLSWVIASMFFGPSGGGLAAASTWFYGVLAIPLLTGAMMIRAYLRFLTQGDELVRLVLLRSAAIGFGVMFALGVVFMLAAQIVGPWKGAGAMTWVAGFFAYLAGFHVQWRSLGVQPPA